MISDLALKQYEQAKQAITARLNEIDYEIALLEGEGLDLADIVGGGNGHIVAH